VFDPVLVLGEQGNRPSVALRPLCARAQCQFLSRKTRFTSFTTHPPASQRYRCRFNIRLAGCWKDSQSALLRMQVMRYRWREVFRTVERAAFLIAQAVH